MKKAKVQFDQEKIKNFFLQHGEKFGFAAFVITFVMILWSTVGIEIDPRVPADLEAKASQAQQVISAAKFDAATEQIALPSPPLGDRASKGREPVQLAQYKTSTEWDPPIFQTKVKRGEPSYLAVRELIATPDIGGVSAAQVTVGADGVPVRTGSPELRGRTWVVITGAIPFAEQCTAFRDLFQNAVFNDPNLDTPRYYDMRVQRAEVTSTAPVQDSDFVDLDVYSALTETAGWDGVAEIVDPTRVEPAVCEPLPPLAPGNVHGEWAAHPRVPATYGAAVAPAFVPVPTSATTAPATGTGPINPLRRRIGGGFVAPATSQADAAAAAAALLAQQRIDYKLFRYFDFTVQPTKSYVYRVKLVLANPNYLLPESVVAEAKLVDGETRETAWSDPSTVVTVPSDSGFLAGLLRPSAGEPAEPKASILLQKWDAATAFKAAKEFKEVYRGSLMNFLQQDTPAAKVDFVTDMLLVDMNGGEALPVPGLSTAAPKAPASMLILGPDGEMTIHSQISDAAAYATALSTVGTPNVPTQAIDPACSGCCSACCSCSCGGE